MIPQWLLMHRNSFVNFAAFGYSRWIAFCAATFLALAGCNTREAALQVAKQYGEVTAFQGKFRIVLLNRQAVDKVLPLLASVPDLEELSIWGVALTDAELRTIGKLDQISGLRLEKCEVDDNDLRFLKPLSNLKQLDLPRNPVTDDGLKELSDRKSVV